jgi:hypothetical protein
MNATRIVSAMGLAVMLAACGDGTSSTGSPNDERKSTIPGTLPAMDVDRDPTPQTGTGGERQSVTGGTTKR